MRQVDPSQREPDGLAAVPTSIIVHERIATWTGKLRPRFATDSRVRWVESRSTGDLVSAVGAAGQDHCLVLIDLGGRTAWAMDGLLALESLPHNAWVLVLDPDNVPAVPTLARELGATLVWSGVVVPPRVETLFRRWLELAAASRSVGGLTTSRRNPLPAR